MNNWFLFLIGVNAGLLLAFVAVFAAHRIGKRRLSNQEKLIVALREARQNLEVAAALGDSSAYELHEAEFWALSAELDAGWSNGIKK